MNGIERRRILKNQILKGKQYDELVRMRHDNAVIWKTHRTLQKDIDRIHTEWLMADTKWFTRSHVSRIQYQQQLEIQLARVNDWIEENLANLDVVERIGLERLITYLQKEIHETKKEIDPDMYIKELGGIDRATEQEQYAR